MKTPYRIAALLVTVASFLAQAIGDETVAKMNLSEINFSTVQQTDVRESSRRMKKTPAVEQEFLKGAHSKSPFVSPTTSKQPHTPRLDERQLIEYQETDVQVSSQRKKNPEVEHQLQERVHTRTPFISRLVPKSHTPSFDQRQIVKYFLPLMFAALVLYAVSYTHQNRLTQRSNSSLELMSSLRIAPRCCVNIIRTNNQSFLVARDATGIKSVVPLEDNAHSLSPDNCAQENK